MGQSQGHGGCAAKWSASEACLGWEHAELLAPHTEHFGLTLLVPSVWAFFLHQVILGNLLSVSQFSSSLTLTGVSTDPEG